MPIAVASTTSPSGMVAAGKHGVGVLSLGAGLVGAKKDLKAQWEMGQESAAAHGQVLRREEWRLVIRVHVAETAEEAMADVREGREYERHHYFRRVGGLRSDTTLEDEIEQDTSIVGTPEHVVGALTRLQEETGGFGGFLVMAHEWANREKTLRSYELMARYVDPPLQGHARSAAGVLRHGRGQQADVRGTGDGRHHQGVRGRRQDAARRSDGRQPALTGRAGWGPPGRGA